VSRRSRRNKRRSTGRLVPSQPTPTAPFNPLPDGVLAARLSQQVSSYSGPIPPPELLKMFDEIDPGRAARLMDWAEDQSRHRMGLESRVVHSDILRSWVGLIAAFVITMTTIIVGGILIYLNHDWAGTGLATTGLAGLAGTFIYGTTSQRRERIDKAKIMSGKK
jgi:uncharacterized membrane protein